jgi:hypothetical protein
VGTLREKKTPWVLGATIIVAAAAFGLTGCSSPAPATGGDAPKAAPSSSAQVDDGDDDDDDDDFAEDLEKDAAVIDDANASSFDTAQAVVDAYVAAGGTCANPTDSGLSLATSSIDCAGVSGRTQTIAVFATPDDAQKWFDAQTVVKSGEVTSYLLGKNWAMVSDGSAQNVAQKMGVRTQTLVLR